MKTNLSIRRHALRLGQYPCQRVPRRRSPGLGGWGATRMLRLGLPVLSLLCGPALLAATFTVTTTDDSGPGSLRAAMFSANASPGADTIAFNLPGAGVQTISPLTQLPTLTNAVTLDGYTQPGSQANTLVVGNDARPLIRLDGRLCTSVQPAGLRLTGSGLVVRGLVIVKFARGLVLDTCNNSTVAGNWIGLDVDNLPSPNIFEGVQVTCPVFSSSGGHPDRRQRTGRSQRHLGKQHRHFLLWPDGQGLSRRGQLHRHGRERDISPPEHH
jgi:hypothetical protein